MNLNKLLSLAFLLCTRVIYAQQPTFSIGMESSPTSLKNPTMETFRIGDNNYVFYQAYNMHEGMQMHLDGFTGPIDTYLCSRDISIPKEGMEIALFEGFIALSNKMYLFRSVYKKEEKRQVLYAHTVDEKGNVDNTGKEVASVSSDKINNAGNFIVKAAEDGNSFVIISEYAFVKETKEKFAVTVCDNNSNKLWTKELELVYDFKKSPKNTPVLTSKGLLYIIKMVEGPKDADFYTVYQFADKGAKVKETILTTEAPKKIVNYDYVINANDDLILSGYYSEDGRVSLSRGGINFKGDFYFRISAASGDIAAQSLNAYDKALSTLKINKLILLKGKLFLLGESNYENSVITDKKDDRGFPIYDTEFYGEEVYISVFDENGKRISTNKIKKRNKSVGDGGFENSFAAGVVGEQVMIVYNALEYEHDGKDRKIFIGSPTIPVIQFIAADGTMGKEFPMIGTNVGGKIGEVGLLPNIFVQINNKEFFFLSRRGKTGEVNPVRLKLP